MTIETLGVAALLVAAGLFLVATIAGAMPRTAAFSAVSTAIGSAALVLVGIAAIAGPAIAVDAGAVLGFVPLDLRFDPLAGTFLLALGGVGVAASIFAIGYHGAARSRLDGLLYPLFIASMTLVIGAANVFAFLLAWELMALISAALVVGPRPGREEARTGYTYLALTHLASAAIVVAFAVLAVAAGTLRVDGLATAAAALPPLTRDGLFLMLLVGFGTKAGMVPLHVWLPRAHPVAPSHVSALMSGVMVAIGAYAFLRFGIGVLGPGPAWWGLLVLALGALSAVMGALYALAEHDLKRLLAFSTIENTGVVLLGLGIALVGASAGSVPVATLGIAAALLHVLGHATFKGLLFLVAGAVQEATHTRDLDRLGGLVRVMPLTALAAFVGAFTASGLPVSAGFASEWLTFQGLFAAGGDPSIVTYARGAAYAAVGALALAAALALATAVKATGMTFLALPRSAAAANAREAGRPMRIAFGLLALGCIGIGLAATPLGAVVQGVAVSALTSAPGPVTDAPPATLGTWAPLAVAIGLAGLVLVTWGISRAGGAEVRRSATWTCGIAPEPAFEYTATSFEKPARMFFERFYRPERAVLVELVPGTPFRRRVRYRIEIDHVIESFVYRPIHRGAVLLARTARRLQQGTLQLYIAYALAAVVVLLVVTR